MNQTTPASKQGRFEAIMVPHMDVLFNYALYLTSDKDTASDLLQETRTAIGSATRNNVSFYTVDARGLGGLSDEMMELFGEIEDSLDRTWEIAQRCKVTLEKVKEAFPKFDVPESHSTDTYFEYVARQGFEKRRGRLEALHAQGLLKHDLAEYSERLDREIRTIQQMQYSGYFLSLAMLLTSSATASRTSAPAPAGMRA